VALSSGGVGQPSGRDKEEKRKSSLVYFGVYMITGFTWIDLA